MQINAIFVNKKDVLDNASEQHYIYTDIMNEEDKENLSKFTDYSSLIIPHNDGDSDDITFFVILRDSNVNCEAFFNGIYGLYTIIQDIDPGMLDFIMINGLTIVLNQLSVVEDYVTSQMVENLFSTTFNSRRVVEV